VIEAGQALILDRIDLARLELADLATTVVLGLACAVAMTTGWLALTWGIVSLAAGALPPPARWLIEAAINLALGIRLAYWHRPRNDQESHNELYERSDARST
jgi:hypothetical protein